MGIMWDGELGGGMVGGGVGEEGGDGRMELESGGWSGWVSEWMSE